MLLKQKLIKSLHILVSLQLFASQLFSQDSLSHHSIPYIHPHFGVSIGFTDFNYNAVNNNLKSIGLPPLNGLQAAISVFIMQRYKETPLFYMVEASNSSQIVKSDVTLSTASLNAGIAEFGFYLNPKAKFRIAPIFGFGLQTFKLSGDSGSGNASISSLSGVLRSTKSFTIENQYYSIHLSLWIRYFPDDHKSGILKSLALNAGCQYSFYQPWQTRAGQVLSGIAYPDGGNIFAKLFLII